MGFPPTMQEGTRLLLTNRAAHPRDSESFRRRRARLSKLIGRCCHTERGTHSPVWPFPPVNIAAPLTGVAERTRSGEPSGSAVTRKFEDPLKRGGGGGEWRKSPEHPMRSETNGFIRAKHIEGSCPARRTESRHTCRRGQRLPERGNRQSPWLSTNTYVVIPPIPALVWIVSMPSSAPSHTRISRASGCPFRVFVSRAD